MATKRFDIELIPSKSHRYLAREYIRLSKHEDSKYITSQLSNILAFGIRIGESFGDVIEIEGEENIILNFKRYLAISDKGSIKKILEICVFQGKTNLIIAFLKNQNELLANKSNQKGGNFQPKIVVSSLESYYERFGHQAFLELIVALKNNGIEIYGHSSVFNFRSLVKIAEPELKNIAADFIRSGLSLYFHKPEIESLDSLYELDPLVIEDLENSGWFERLLKEATYNINHTLKLFLSNDSNIDLNQLIDELIHFPTLLNKFIFEIFDSMMTNKVENQVVIDLSLKMLNLNKINQLSKTIFIFGIYLHLNNMPKEAKSLIENYKSEYHIDAVKKLKNTKRYDFFTSWNGIFKFIDLYHEDSKIIEALFRILDLGGIKSLFIDSSAFVYLAQNYPNTLTLDLMKKIENIKGEFSSIDLFILLKSISKFSSTEHWFEIATNYRNLLDTGHLNLAYDLSLRFNDVEIIKRACNLINENQLAIDFENSWNFDSLINQLDTESLMDVCRARLKSGLMTDNDLLTIIFNTRVNKFNLIEDLIHEMFLSGISIDWAVYNSIGKRYLYNKRYNEILSLISKFNISLHSDSIRLYIMKLISFRELDQIKAYDDLYRQISDMNLNNELQQTLGKVRQYITNFETIDNLNSLLFDFSEPSFVREAKVSQVTTRGPQRDKTLVSSLKDLYEDKCQVCTERVETPFGFMSEAAHIQGIGHPHYGPDCLGNLLILCPNHHTSFDNAGWFIQKDFQLIKTESMEIYGRLVLHPDHKLIDSCLDYQKNYAIKAKTMGKRAWKAFSVQT
jgi:predicted restriction endonuclease